MDYTGPERTIDLLDELQDLGFGKVLQKYENYIQGGR